MNAYLIFSGLIKKYETKIADPLILLEVTGQQVRRLGPDGHKTLQRIVLRELRKECVDKEALSNLLSDIQKSVE
jgi:hypothetical protein